MVIVRAEDIENHENARRYQVVCLVVDIPSNETLASLLPGDRSNDRESLEGALRASIFTTHAKGAQPHTHDRAPMPTSNSVLACTGAAFRRWPPLTDHNPKSLVRVAIFGEASGFLPSA